MEVVIGTYDQSLCALRFCSGDDDNNFKFEATFSDHGHGGCVKAVACNEKFLASGSTDETIRLFDLKRRIELGRLNQQEGTITCLAFCNDSHMLSGSKDGTICVWECKTWDCLKVLKGHREEVTSLSVHPSGRLALSVSTDKSLRTWNLLTGRSAYVTNIKQVANVVLWSPTGETYAVATRTQVIVYKVSTAALVYTIEATRMVLALSFIDDDFLAVGGEMTNIEIHDVKSEKCVQRLSGHQARVKGLASVKNIDTSGDPRVLLFSVSSDGALKAWSFLEGKIMEGELDRKLTKQETKFAQLAMYNCEPDLLCQFDLSDRPTCMTLFSGETKIRDERKQKTKKKESNEAVTTEKKEQKQDTKIASDISSKPEGRNVKSKKRKKI